jgi:hypothetical protein
MGSIGSAVKRDIPITNPTLNWPVYEDGEMGSTAFRAWALVFARAREPLNP